MDAPSQPSELQVMNEALKVDLPATLLLTALISCALIWWGHPYAIFVWAVFFSWNWA